MRPIPSTRRRLLGILGALLVANGIMAASLWSPHELHTWMTIGIGAGRAPHVRIWCATLATATSPLREYQSASRCLVPAPRTLVIDAWVHVPSRRDLVPLAIVAVPSAPLAVGSVSVSLGVGLTLLGVWVWDRTWPQWSWPQSQRRAARSPASRAWRLRCADRRPRRASAGAAGGDTG